MDDGGPGGPVGSVHGLDDFDARPGSITSLLRTFVGLHVRKLGGWIAVADLVGLLREAGLTATGVRSAVSRAKAKGLLTAEVRGGTPGYVLPEGASRMLERGDAAIFSRHRHAVEDGWCLLSYSVPEGMRPARYRLRRLLTQLGCGTVADGLCIAPHRRARGLESHLEDAGLRRWVTVFDAADLRTSEDLAAACALWWDLDATATLHRDFLERFSEGAAARGTDAPSGRDDFVTQLRVVDAWRPIPYLDPGLALEALPSDWPGDAAADLFAEIDARVSGPAAEYVARAVTVSSTGE
ncbi:MAG: PaaX family transcriptional regulator [Brevibacterium yomogidense]|uniref:PaaX family transcriptional regulator n=1 Tax=Brevibacterium sp. Mu109 TaxID=1255669 RepID=UPI000C3A6A9D|nr:PaaX family transcriptional regulator C-terminal domain-containing protein [Brevibacterium sp. Mu109]SMX78951.1 transcriptional regulator, PaaX family [Brevibacterium sp. Mu109]